MVAAADGGKGHAIQLLVDQATGPVADNETFALGEGYVTGAGLPSALPR